MRAPGGPGIMIPRAELEEEILSDVRASGVISDEIAAMGL